jgi:hypothetical protein
MATGKSSDPTHGTASCDPEAESPPCDTDSDGTLAPPRILTHRAEASALPPPIRDADALVALRRRWAQISASTGRGAPGDERGEGSPARGPQRVPGSVRAKVKARVATAAAGVQAQDRAMTGELVRALDVISQRVDELASRLHDLESLVQEVVEVTSEELTRMQVAFGAAQGHHDDGLGREHPARA